METIDSIFERLRLIDAKPDTPISLFKIGVPLIEAGHSEELIRIGTLHPERD